MTIATHDMIVVFWLTYAPFSLLTVAGVLWFVRKFYPGGSK